MPTDQFLAWLTSVENAARPMLTLDTMLSEGKGAIDRVYQYLLNRTDARAAFVTCVGAGAAAEDVDALLEQALWYYFNANVRRLLRPIKVAKGLFRDTLETRKKVSGKAKKKAKGGGLAVRRVNAPRCNDPLCAHGPGCPGLAVV